MSFTPRPWRLTKSDSYQFSLRIVGPKGQAITSFGNQIRWMPTKEVLANALLMTAAPELLEACQAWLKEADQHTRIQYSPAWEQECYQRFKNAVAKATGDNDS